LHKNFLWAISLLCLIACNNYSRTREAKADSTVAGSPLSAAETATVDTLSRKRIRTADIKCRVNNVFETTTGLERLVTRLDGAITESHIENELFRTKELAYKNDSLKKIQIYTPTAHLTLRIPEKYLDSVVNELAQIARFISYRTLRQTDVTLQYLSNTLRNKSEAGSQISIANTEMDKLELLQYKEARQQKNIDRRLENLQISDNVRYATLTVMLFQPTLTDISVQINPEAVTRTGFWEDLGASLLSGTEALKSVTLLILSIWPLWIVVFVAWKVFKRFGKSVFLPGRPR
jgi:hypothetical protein